MRFLGLVERQQGFFIINFHCVSRDSSVLLDVITSVSMISILEPK